MNLLDRLRLRGHIRGRLIALQNLPTKDDSQTNGETKMGYAFAMSACVGCGRMFSYNPVRVPSLRVNGRREPVCRDCVARANPKRIANGLEPIVPADDAYEAVDEQEL